MVLTPHNITKHELIGLEIEVTGSENRSLIGKKGIITDETRNTLTIRNGKDIRLMKSAIVFTVMLDGRKVEVDGRAVVGKPEDRLKR